MLSSGSSTSELVWSSPVSQTPLTPGPGATEGWLLQSVFEDLQNAASAASSHATTKTQARDSGQAFHPAAPDALGETGLPERLIAALVLKYLLHVGKAPGRDIAKQIRLPFRVLDNLVKTLKVEQVLAYTRLSGVSDFEYTLTEQGRVQARQLKEQSTYYGATPVTFADYFDSVRRQALSRVKIQPGQVSESFRDLTLSPQMVRRVGQALAGSATMLLFGNPGNGKTSIAERLIKPFSDGIWIPRAICVDGDVIRLFDPAIHHELPAGEAGTFDDRWVRIERPIVIVGGELTLEALELQFNPASHIYEAPVQMKSNCGVLLIDDFGRQKVEPETILNRWIVPLEKRVDYLDLSNGKRVCVPFEQMLVFSTNLRPADVVDEAFLRRITYKVEIPDPTEAQFRAVFRQVAAKLEIAFTATDLDDLIARHYVAAQRPLRFCHPRDLLQQIATACEFNSQPRTLTRELVDDAVMNYFCVG